jgi:hypothetical protein
VGSLCALLAHVLRVLSYTCPLGVCAALGCQAGCTLQAFLGQIAAVFYCCPFAAATAQVAGRAGIIQPRQTTPVVVAALAATKVSSSCQLAGWLCRPCSCRGRGVTSSTAWVWWDLHAVCFPMAHPCASSNDCVHLLTFSWVMLCRLECRGRQLAHFCRIQHRWRRWRRRAQRHSGWWWWRCGAVWPW